MSGDEWLILSDFLPFGFVECFNLGTTRRLGISTVDSNILK